jgi:ankyrin repeat protein
MVENAGLHQMIRDLKLEEARGLLKSPKGPELARQRDENGNLPLHVAIIACTIATIDLLLQIHPEGLKEKS